MKIIVTLCMLLVMPVVALSANNNKLLGSIDNNVYTSPKGDLHIPVPFDVSKTSGNIIKDAVYATSINVIFENRRDNVRHRVELSHLTKSSFQEAVSERLFQYRGLMNRAYPGTAVITDFDGSTSPAHYLYKQANDKQVRFHFVQVWPFNKRMIIVWSDFTEPEDNPAHEEQIINGEHPVIRQARQLAGGIK